MIRAIYNNKKYKIIGKYGFKYSNREVTFNDITIDFTGGTIDDIPLKYQEVKVVEIQSEDSTEENILFTGFVENVKPSTMKMPNEERELSITLLSPLKMATKRSVTIFGIFKLNEAIRRVFEPLTSDGFVIKELNVPDGQITLNYLIKTVEECMNEISSKRNIFWYVNEKKEIFINSLNYLFGLEPKRVIKGKDTGQLMIQPEITTNEYANIINFKNVRVIYKQHNSMGDSHINDGYPIVEAGKKIKAGDIVEFKNPIIIDEQYLREYLASLDSDTPIQVQAFHLWVTNENDTYSKSFWAYIPWEGDYTISPEITFSDDGDEEGTVVLQRDSFFPNLITGFKWNGEDCFIYTIESDIALRYTTMRFIDSLEIEKCKNKISETGQIETTLDLQEKWFSLTDLINYARSLIVQNSNKVNQVTLQYDIDTELKIGDIVEIDRPEFLIQGKFAVSDITYNYEANNKQLWKYILKNSDLYSTFIDLFRKEDKQENQEVVNSEILSNYIEEKIVESHVVEEAET